MKLTDMVIKKAKPKDRAYSLADGKGLSLLIEPNGSKGWRFRYRFESKAKMLSFGIYPEVTLLMAREKREAARKLLMEGINPSDERKAKKEKIERKVTHSFENVAREWHKVKSDRWSLKYRDEIIDTFEKDIFPFIGGKEIAEIEPLELLEVLKKIEARGALEKMRKVRQRCGEVFKFAIVTGRAKYNPAPDLASVLTPPKKKHFPFLSAKELPFFLRDLSGYTGSFITKTATKILMLTAVRTQELRFAKWEYIDLENGIWEIPAEIMKMKRPHVVPLSFQCIELFQSLKPISGSYPLVFIGRNDHNKPISKESINQVIELLGYKGRLTGHGFRHTMSTILHEQGYNSSWIETQLAHIDKNSIRGTYNHAQYIEGRREMLQWYADYMDALENGENIIHGNFKRA